MHQRLFPVAALSALSAVSGMALLPAHAATLAQWNFNDANLIVDAGSGTAALLGGTSTSGFNSGAGSSDPVQPGSGWSISTFAAQGAEDKQRGAVFTVSTLGYEDITFSYDMRHSNTAPGNEVVQVSTNGSTFIDLVGFASDNGGAAQPLWFNLRLADLSALPAADNQATLTFRVVAAFAPGSGAYASSNGALNTYGTTGTWRFDMVTISGTPVAAVPEPGGLALMLAGAAALGFLLRRRA